jgi:hypothetical protein
VPVRSILLATSRPTRRRVMAMLGAGVLSGTLVSCGGAGKKSAPASSVDFSSRFAAFEPADEPNGDPTKVTWPEFVTRAGDDIRRLYDFQLVNGDLMRYMPCFCGCGRTSGHRNNRDCYVQAVNADGTVVFDSMAPT